MSNSEKLLLKKTKLKQEYIQLIEDAYNHMQTDHAFSDFAEYQANKVLYKLNKLKFVIGNSQLQAN